MKASSSSLIHQLLGINDLVKKINLKLILNCFFSFSELRHAFADVVTPIFCTTHIAAPDDEKKVKLSKLLTLWETNRYFHGHIQYDIV